MSELSSLPEKVNEIIGKLERDAAHYQILPLVRSLKDDIDNLIGKNFEPLAPAEEVEVEEKSVKKSRTTKPAAE
jgi:hypothetical protein